ncbi:hypothetical protein ABOM_008162 [Aspergillus bombycis]|uniref:Ankyrin repeat protein n=1 Tax=Aspergillus bombycis TaxID=109264 RepID=A0A1F7ZTI6_9EURO|nr:hypothetical protein ABOM_008162 [Aspergillus bombycis]OGM42737.1 hypothetical protein ABOM_008162 [Aspergillus bombycis]
MLLLQYNADPSIPNDDNKLPLDFATFDLLDDEGVCHALYDKGAKTTDFPTFTSVCAYQSILCIKKLVGNATNIAGAWDSYGQDLTILHSVMMSSSFQHPISPTAPPPGYLSPLLQALDDAQNEFRPQSLQIARVLLEYDRTLLDDECKAWIEERRSWQMPAEYHEDFKAIAWIAEISQEQATNPSHSGG